MIMPNESNADMSGVQSAPQSTRYLFSTHLDFDSKFIGETPQGDGIDVKLKAAKIWTDKARWEHDWKTTSSKDGFGLFENRPKLLVTNDGFGLPTAAGTSTLWDELPPWLGLGGSFIDWTDWIIVRRDGVAEFNGRATIATDDLGDDGNRLPCLIGFTFSGVVDLRDYAAAPERITIAELALDADGVDKAAFARKFAVKLSVRFEGGRRPPSWAAEEYQPQRAQWKYRHLFRGQFLACGFGTKDAHGHLAALKLSVWDTAFIHPLEDVRQPSSRSPLPT
jgi:hypothetical protein